MPAARVVPPPVQGPVKIARLILQGRRLDKKKKLLKILGLKKGDTLPPDRLLKKLDFLKSNLDRLGYHVTVHERWKGNLVYLKVKLAPVRMVRHVYVRGNWPLFESDIVRRLRYRPGSRLPQRKEQRAAFERQKQRILQYLRREGYFRGDVEIVVEKTKKKHVVNLLVLLRPLWKISPLWIWNPNRYRVGKITAIGNKVVSTAAIRKIFKHRILWWERSFTLKVFKKDIKRLIKLYHKKGFPEIRIRHDFSEDTSLDHKTRRVNITLRIRENRRLELVFVGNRKLKDSKLRKAVTFFKEGSGDNYELKQSVISVQRLYQRKGYFQARVYATREPTRGRVDRIVFNIYEGKRFKVRSISFRYVVRTCKRKVAVQSDCKPGDIQVVVKRPGRGEAVSPLKLRKVVKTKIFPLLGTLGLGSGGYITAVQLRQDTVRITRTYKNKGFLDVKVWGDVATDPRSFGRPGATALLEALGKPRGKRSNLHVRFLIYEGKRVKVASINLEGVTPKIKKAISKKPSLKKGKPFTAKALNRDLIRIKRICADRGHPYVVVKWEVKAAPDKKGVIVTYRFKLGPVVRFGEVFVRGNFKTSTSVILRELTFKKGQRFSLGKVEESRRNLRSLAIFKASRISFLGLRAKDEVVHTLVQVTERYDDYGSVEIGVGASTDNLWFVSLLYANRNLFGWGKQLELFGEYGDRIQSARLTYKDHRFLRTKLILDITGFIRNEDTVRLGQLLTYGLSLTVEKRFTEKLRTYIRYEVKRVQRKEPLVRVAGGLDESARVDVFTNTATIGPTFVWDRRNNPLSPTKGFQIVASVRWASKYLLADLLTAPDFVHLRLAGQLFIPMPLGIVIAQGVRYDHGFPIGSTVMLPKTERFYAGGDTTVRGYERDRLFSSLIWMPLSPNSSAQIYRVVPEGGNIRLIYNLELQFPIWKKSILFGLPLMGAFFFDAGSIVNTFAGDGFKHFFARFKHSVGTALRLVTPVGSISVEYAVPMEPTYGTDPTGRFHFNFGFIF